MNKTASEAVRFVRELAGVLTKDPAVEIVLAPPFTALESVHGVLGSVSHLALGAQNLHWEPQGAFTGEISGPMKARASAFSFYAISNGHLCCFT